RTQYSDSQARYFTHNQRNMLTQIQHFSLGGGGDANRYFTYNGVGERVFGVDGNPTPSYWVYDGQKMLRETVAGSSAHYRHNTLAQECDLSSRTAFEDSNGLDAAYAAGPGAVVNALRSSSGS